MNTVPEQQSTNTNLNKRVFPGDHPSIVYLHGLGGSTRYWSSVKDFSQQKYKVNLIDLLGFGDSSKPFCRYTLEKHLQALLPVLEDENDFVLVGHSLGAVIALAYTARFPHKVRKLVLIGMPCFEGVASARNWFGSRVSGWVYTNYLAIVITCIFTRRVAAYFLPFIIKGYPLEVIQDLVKHNVMSSTTSLWNIVYNHDPRPDCASLPAELEVCCIHSEDDDLAPAENVKRLAKEHNWALVLLSGYKHHPWLHNPESCWSAIVEGLEN